MPVDAHSSLTSKEFAFANMPAAKISQTLVREEIRKNLLGQEMKVGGGRCCSARGWIFKVIRENDDSVYCTWCTFQGFSFSDKLYHWRNRLGVEIGRGITVCFFLCNDWYKWKGKGCLSHLLSAPLGMVLLVDIFPQGETHTDRLDWVACLLPPSPLLIRRFLFF